MRSLTHPGGLRDSRPICRQQILKGRAFVLLMHACQESGVAGVLADRVEQWVYADERHVEAVAVERVLERVERMVEFVDAKIVDADLVSGAGARLRW